MRRHRFVGVALLLGLLALPSTARAQLRIGVERTVDEARWHFDNPSSFDTAALVPHFFEQTYSLDNTWLVAEASYRGGIDWRTTIAATPVRQARASDYDTFFNPGSVVWVSGTSGDARMHSIRLAQAVDLGRVGGVRLAGGYRLRVDLADFLAGDRTDVRNGVRVTQRVVTTREYTNGQSHDVFIEASHTRDLSTAWQFRATGQVSPASVQRLAIRLPDKYPGQTLVYRTTNLSVSSEIEFVRGHGRWPLTLRAGVLRSFNYGSRQTLVRRSAHVGVGLGRAW